MSSRPPTAGEIVAMIQNEFLLFPFTEYLFRGLATTATTGARHDQLANATLAAWFGTQTRYLAMAAMSAC
jgi:hypothetical protein